MNKIWISVVFAVAAIYDGVFGLAFLIAPGAIFDRFSVPPPNHPGYVQFPAALLVVFALMFLAVAVNPVVNRNLIPYGMLLKVSYCAVVFWHWLSTDLPGMWKPWAVIDLVFLLVFVAAYRSLGTPEEQEKHSVRAAGQD